MMTRPFTQMSKEELLRLPSGELLALAEAATSEEKAQSESHGTVVMPGRTLALQDFEPTAALGAPKTAHSNSTANSKPRNQQHHPAEKTEEAERRAKRGPKRRGRSGRSGHKRLHYAHRFAQSGTCMEYSAKMYDLEDCIGDSTMPVDEFFALFS